MTTRGRWDSKRPIFSYPDALPRRAVYASLVFKESEKISHLTVSSASRAETANAVEENTDLQLEFADLR